MAQTVENFVICKGTSGMGNRILAACTALLYGEITGRTVIIDWRDRSYSEAGDNAFPKFFDCPTAASIEQLPGSGSVYPALWVDNLDVTLGKLQSQLKLKGFADMSFDPARANYAEDVIVFCAYTHKINSLRPLFTGDFAPLQDKTNPEILRSVLDAKMPLVQAIRDPIDAFKQQHFAERAIGVHVRYTDIKVPLDKILGRVHQVLKKQPQASIFLATDSQEVVTKFKNRFPNVVTTNKWFPPGGQRMHQNWDSCPDRYQNGVEALTDLFLLAACNSLVFSSKSSFGYVASLLSTADRRQLFDVEQDDSLWQSLKRQSKRVLKTVR